MATTKKAPVAVQPPYFWEEACKHLVKKDRVMKRLIPQFGDAFLETRGDAFVTLARSIVGLDEVDLDRHHISWVSPLARALMKAGPGDVVTLRAPNGTQQLQILEVRYQRIPVAPFTEPPGAEAASIPSRTVRRV